MRELTESVIVTTDDGAQVPGTLTVLKTPSAFLACLWCHDRLYMNLMKERSSVSAPVWDEPDEMFLTFVRFIYQKENAWFAFARPEIQAAVTGRLASPALLD